MATRTVKITFRLSKDEDAQVAKAAKDGGYLSPSAFIRAAIRNELSGRGHEITEADRRIAANLDRLSADILHVSRGQQALFAVTDIFVKTFLTCVPEPPRDAISQSVARARERYVRFVASAGQGMVGDSHAAMRELVDRADQR
jgi:Arc/MetJ-type ribon-helix-helix transcriptional regulator